MKPVFPPLGSLRVSSRVEMSDDLIALTRNGKIVWVGPFGSPVEDVDFDGVILSPGRYAEFRHRLPGDGK